MSKRIDQFTTTKTVSAGARALIQRDPTNAAGQRATLGIDVQDLIAPFVSSRALCDNLYFDGVTSGAKGLWTLGAAGNLSGSSRTIMGSVYIPTAAEISGKSWALWQLSSSSSLGVGTVTGFSVVLNTNGNPLFVRQYGPTTSDAKRWNSTNNPVTLFGGQIVPLALRLTVGASPEIFINGVAFAGADQSDIGSPSAWGTHSSDYLVLGGSAGSAPTLGTFTAPVVVNAALTDAEIQTHAQTGRMPTWCAVGGGNMVPQTSGTLRIGWKYRIVSYLGSDSFTNVGAPSNATGIEFVATGTTPTTWMSSTQIIPVGPIAKPVIQPCRFLDDAGGNGIPGILTSGVTPITPRKDWRIRATVDMSSTGNKQLLGAALFESPQNQAIDSVEAIHGANGATYSIGDGATATVYTASAAQTSGRKRLTLATPFPADSAKTGIYANVTVAGASETAVPVIVRGHKTD